MSAPHIRSSIRAAEAVVRSVDEQRAYLVRARPFLRGKAQEAADGILRAIEDLRIAAARGIREYREALDEISFGDDPPTLPGTPSSKSGTMRAVSPNGLAARVGAELEKGRTP